MDTPSNNGLRSDVQTQNIGKFDNCVSVPLVNTGRVSTFTLLPWIRLV